MESKLGLALRLNGIREVNHTCVKGIAGGSLNGELVSRNETFHYTNTSAESDIYAFENSCKYQLREH